MIDTNVIFTFVNDMFLEHSDSKIICNLCFAYSIHLDSKRICHETWPLVPNGLLNHGEITTTNNIFHDNDFTSRIEKQMYNSWMCPIFLIYKYTIYFVDYFENRGVNLFNVHALNPNNSNLCFYLIKSDTFLNILFLI